MSDVDVTGSTWNTLDWPGLVKEYAAYWKLPFVAGFGGIEICADGRLPVRILRLREHQGHRAITRVQKTLDAALDIGALPGKPSALTQAHIDKVIKAVAEKRLDGVRAEELQTFWEAIILTRAGYRCEYCGRSAFGVYEERGGRSALRMIVDHREPRRNGGRSYAFANSAPACWSCNHLKGELPCFAFEQELRSLARAVISNTESTG